MAYTKKISDQYIDGMTGGNKVDSNGSGGAVRTSDIDGNGVGYYTTSSQPTTSSKTTSTTSTSGNTYFDLLRSQNNKEFLDTQIQLSNAKQNAYKNTMNTINSQGFGGTGYGNMAPSVTSNQYLQAMGNAQIAKNEQDNAISEQEQEAAQTTSDNNFKTLTTLLGNASTTSDMDSVLGKYGITVNSDGSFNYSNSDLDDESKKQLEATYSLMKSGMENNEFISNNTYGTGYSDYGQAISSIKTNAGASASDDKWGVKNELAKLFSDKTLAYEGSVVKLQNANNGSNNANDNVYMVYHNGKWYQTSADYYGKRGGSAVIKGK